MSPIRIGSTPVEFTVEGVNVSLGNVQCTLVPKTMQGLKFLQDLSADEKHEEIMSYMASNAASIAVRVGETVGKGEERTGGGKEQARVHGEAVHKGRGQPAV